MMLEGVPLDRLVALSVISALVVLVFRRGSMQPQYLLLLAALVAAIAIVLGNLGRVVSVREWSTLLSSAVFYSGVIFLPAVLFRMAASHPGGGVRREFVWAKSRWMAIPLLLASGLSLLMLTNPWHHQFLLPLPGGGESYRWGWWLQAGVGSFWTVASMAVYGSFWFLRRSIVVTAGRVRPSTVMAVAPIPVIVAIFGFEPSSAGHFDPVIVTIAIAAVLYTFSLYAKDAFLTITGWTALVRSATDGVVVLDSRGRIMNGNPACSRFVPADELQSGAEFWPILAGRLGHGSGEGDAVDPELLGRSLTDPSLLDPADAPVYRYGPQLDRWLLIEPTPIIGRSGRAIGYSLRLRDVTAQREAEQKLRDSESKYRALVETTSDVIWSADREGRFTFVNQAFLRRVDRPIEDVLGRCFLEFTPEEEHERLASTFGGQLCNASPIQTFPTKTVAPDGSTSYFRVTAVPLRNSAGLIVGLTGTACDTTEERRMTEQLRSSEKHGRQILANACFGVLVSSKDQMLFSNAAAAQITGYSEAELSERSFLDLVAPEDRERASALEAVGRTGESVSDACELALIRKDASRCWVEAYVHQLEYRGNGARMVQILDITKRRQAEAAREGLERQVRQAQKLEAVGTLAGGIAHDFNNLLTSVLGRLEIARLQLDPSLPAQAELQEAELSAERAASLARQLLAFSQPQLTQVAASFRPERLERVFESAQRMLSSSIPETVSVRVGADPGIPPVSCDAGLLEQVLINLGLNANDAMPQGGELRIWAEAIEVGSDDACLQAGGRPGPFVRISVQDTGEGIEPEAIDRIFDPFFTTKAPNGTGLGLAMVYGSVQAHQGWVTVRSTPGQGSIFEVYLPLVSGPEVPPEPAGVVDAIGGTGALLFVEDDRGVREVGAKLLEGTGYKVLTASDGIEALEVYERNSEEIVAVVTDLTMPRMGGRQLLEALRGAGSRVPVIVTTGYASGMNADELLAKGFANVLLKPFRRNQLCGMLHRALSGPGADALDPD